MKGPIQKLIILSSFWGASLAALEIDELSWEDEGPSAQKYNSFLQDALNEKNWWAVVDYATILSYHFPESPFSEETSFIIGEAYLGLDQPLIANEYFTAYLNTSSLPRHFEETLIHKFEIAERFKNGEKKPLFDSHKAPKWLSAKEDAIEIYEEVIASLPASELAAKSLLGKALLQAEEEYYKESIESLDKLIQKFPKHELAAEAYLDKVKVFHLQCKNESLDPDLLDQAKEAIRKFQIAFPREERIKDAEEYLTKMNEAFAQNLLNTGGFFEKTKKKPAAKIYFQKVVTSYPETDAAIEAEKRLNRL